MFLLAQSLQRYDNVDRARAIASVTEGSYQLKLVSLLRSFIADAS
jgi:hypothetical protein